MNLETSLAVLLLIAAIAAAFGSWRLSRWVPVDAELVRSDLMGPYGLSPTRFAQQLELQSKGQGVMGPEIVHYAELIYLVDGVPHVAELMFDGPPDRKVRIRFDPKNPDDYTTDQPNPGFAIALASLGLVLLLYFRWCG